MSKEVIVKISNNGEIVEMDAEGFTGASCKDLMKRTIDALGTVKEEKQKPEYFANQGSGVQVGA